MEPMMTSIAADPAYESLDIPLDATALFEQYEPVDETLETRRVEADTCENLYSLPQ
jgi:hypothetical protein